MDTYNKTYKQDVYSVEKHKNIGYGCAEKYSIFLLINVRLWVFFQAAHFMILCKYDGNFELNFSNFLFHFRLSSVL